VTCGALQPRRAYLTAIGTTRRTATLALPSATRLFPTKLSAHAYWAGGQGNLLSVLALIGGNCSSRRFFPGIYKQRPRVDIILKLQRHTKYCTKFCTWGFHGGVLLPEALFVFASTTSHVIFGVSSAGESVTKIP
jgi:hypothetical protein